MGEELGNFKRTLWRAVSGVLIVASAASGTAAHAKPSWLERTRQRIVISLSENIEPHFTVGALAEKRIDMATRYPSSEVYDNLLRGNQKALMFLENPLARFWQKDYPAEALMTIGWITEALTKVATRDQLGELDKLYDSSLDIISANLPHTASEISRRWRRARRIISMRKGPLRSLNSGVARTPSPRMFSNNTLTVYTAPATGDASPKATGRDVDLAHLEKTLKDNIIEQEETVQRIMDVELRFEIYGGKNPDPELLLLAGMPGSGKDTSAENWVDGVYGYTGASAEHLHCLDPISKANEAWSVLGSSTGFVGSGSLSPYIHYLVAHSGGKYLIKSRPGSGGNTMEYVIDNPEWHGEALPNQPSRAFVFVNEWHDWAKKATNIVLKESMEKGVFKINNPNGGLKRLQIPGVVFIFGANYGIERLAARELNGARNGKPLTYEQSLQRWQKFKDDKPAIKKSILSSNGSANNPDRSEDAKGVSEEVLNRFKNSRLVIQKPLSPAALQRIVAIRLAKLQERLQHAEGKYGSLDLSFSPELVQFLQRYNYLAEENARPMKDKVDTLVEAPINAAIKEGLLSDPAGHAAWSIGLVTYEDGTYGLRFVENKLVDPRRFDRVMEATLADKKRPPISDAEIDRLLASGEKMKESVIASDSLINRIVTSMLSAKEQSYEREDKTEAKNKAHVFMFLGPSSTGKTQLAKAATEADSGSADDLKIIDFSNVQNIDDLKHKILGPKTSLGDGVPSEFMKEYDRRGGQAYFAFDEFSNAPKNVHMALYDILREPEVRTFSDNEPRRMGGVHIFITGNCGQEWYNDIPKTLPMLMQMYAMERIYADAISSPGFLQETLDKCFPNPLTARVDQIVFFSPFAFKELRELTQLKVQQAFKDLQAREGRRGWSIGFTNEAAYRQFLADVEDHGFTLKDQGASIDRYVQIDFKASLRALLLQHKVPSEAKVHLGRLGVQPAHANGQPALIYQVSVAGFAAPLELALPARIPDNAPEESPEQKAMTSGHEAGHELVRKVLFGDKYSSHKISILPGVQRIANRMVVYRGIAESKRNADFAYTYQAVLNELSVMHAGYLAQMILSKNRFHDAGKQNDLQRASEFARRAILEFGLSSVWGYEGIPQGVELKDFIAGLPPERKTLLVQEEQRFMRAAILQALAILLRHRDDALIPMAELLLAKGELQVADFADFYAAHPVGVLEDQDIAWAEKHWNEELNHPERTESRSLDPELIEEYKIPARIANLEEYAQAQKAARVAEVPSSPKTLYFAPPTNEVLALAMGSTSCEESSKPQPD